MVVFGEADSRRILAPRWRYNQVRTHLSLKECPIAEADKPLATSCRFRSSAGYIISTFGVSFSVRIGI